MPYCLTHCCVCMHRCFVGLLALAVFRYLYERVQRILSLPSYARYRSKSPPVNDGQVVSPEAPQPTSWLGADLSTDTGGGHMDKCLDSFD